MKAQSLEASKISLRPEEVHRVSLGGLGGAGYTWTQSVEGEPGVVSVSEEADKPPAMPAPGGPSPGTSSTVYNYVITARKQGTARVRFVLRRPWERDKPPLREVVVDVSVLP